MPATELKQQGSYGSNLLGQLTGGVLGTSAKDMEAAASKERQEALLQREALEMEAAKRKPPSGPWESFLRPIYRVVCTPHNLLVVGVMVVLNLSMSHYITSHQAYLQIMLDRGGNSTVAEAISDAFDTLFPILGFCASIGVSPLLTTHAWCRVATLSRFLRRCGRVESCGRSRVLRDPHLGSDASALLADTDRNAATQHPRAHRAHEEAHGGVAALLVSAQVPVRHAP